jgi:hypothetical protein
VQKIVYVALMGLVFLLTLTTRGSRGQIFQSSHRYLPERDHLDSAEFGDGQRPHRHCLRKRPLCSGGGFGHHPHLPLNFHEGARALGPRPRAFPRRRGRPSSLAYRGVKISGVKLPPLPLGSPLPDVSINPASSGWHIRW